MLNHRPAFEFKPRFARGHFQNMQYGMSPAQRHHHLGHTTTPEEVIKLRALGADSSHQSVKHPAEYFLAVGHGMIETPGIVDKESIDVPVDPMQETRQSGVLP